MSDILEEAMLLFLRCRPDGASFLEMRTTFEGWVHGITDEELHGFLMRLAAGGSGGATEDAGSDVVTGEKTPPFEIDEDHFAITSAGRVCTLRNTKAFHLFVRLARRLGVYVPVERLIDDLWPDVEVEKNTVQQTASRLNRALREAGMAHLVVDGQSNKGHYALRVR